MKALVTGGGGFLGGAIARLLLQRGQTVRSFARGRYDDLDSLGVEQVQGDLVDANAVRRAVEGCDLVFHVAARAGAWGSWEDFFLPNVLGTRHVLDACREVGVQTLVFTSSPSVVFDGSDMEGVDESTPYPAHYEAHYPHTKAMAEREVLAANGDRLATVALRPHLIWGPRDTNLVPRIIARGKSGRLRRIGRDEKLIDTVYIDDAAKAHLLAADRLLDPEARSTVAGKAYFISSGQPIGTWTMINHILAAADLPPVDKTVSPNVALGAGWLMEKAWHLTGRTEEPPMTRWVAKELATAHWFDISAARRDLGYTPEVGLEEGLEALRGWLLEAE